MCLLMSKVRHNTASNCLLPHIMYIELYYKCLICYLDQGVTGSLQETDVQAYVWV